MAEPLFYANGNTPSRSDTLSVVQQKILGAVRAGGGGGGGGGTFDPADPRLDYVLLKAGASYYKVKLVNNAGTIELEVEQTPS